MAQKRAYFSVICIDLVVKLSYRHDNLSSILRSIAINRFWGFGGVPGEKGQHQNTRQIRLSSISSLLSVPQIAQERRKTRVGQNDDFGGFRDRKVVGGYKSGTDVAGFGPIGVVKPEKLGGWGGVYKNHRFYRFI